MKKRTIAIFTIMMLALHPAIGQIIFTDEDHGSHPRSGSSSSEINIMVPMQNANVDQWKEEIIPLGNGLLLLAGLGGAYLLKKKRSKK